jgi:hypothetical protein
MQRLSPGHIQEEKDEKEEVEEEEVEKFIQGLTP